MQYTILLEKSVSIQATNAIRAMIVSGDLPDGEQINEVHLSAKLGISRTPIREGLRQLVAEQLVEIKPRRGFFVRMLTPEEFSDLYDLRPMLDPQALLLGGQLSVIDITELEAANKAFRSAKSAIEATIADEAFHRCLISRCPNRVLLDMINNLMLRTRRYEVALFRETQPIQVANDEHEQIILAIMNQELERAAELLRQNLTSGKKPIIDWLESRAKH